MAVVCSGWGPSGRRSKSCLPDQPEAASSEMGLARPARPAANDGKLRMGPRLRGAPSCLWRSRSTRGPSREPAARCRRRRALARPGTRKRSLPPPPASRTRPSTARRRPGSDERGGLPRAVEVMTDGERRPPLSQLPEATVTRIAGVGLHIASPRITKEGDPDEHESARVQRRDPARLILGVPLAENVVRQWPQMGEIVDQPPHCGGRGQLPRAHTRNRQAFAPRRCRCGRVVLRLR